MTSSPLGNSFVSNCPLANYPRSICSFGQLSVGQLSVGQLSIWATVHLGNCPLGNCPCFVRTQNLITAPIGTSKVTRLKLTSLAVAVTKRIASAVSKTTAQVYTM